MNTTNTHEKINFVKGLNEKRTQGRAMLYKTVYPNKNLQIAVTSTDENGATHTILNATNYPSLDVDLNDELTKKAEANAKYAAMAINNFESVANALYTITDFIDKINDNARALTSSEVFIYELCKQTLNNIK